MQREQLRHCVLDAGEDGIRIIELRPLDDNRRRRGWSALREDAEFLWREAALEVKARDRRLRASERLTIERRSAAGGVGHACAKFVAASVAQRRFVFAGRGVERRF